MSNKDIVGNQSSLGTVYLKIKLEKSQNQSVWSKCLENFINYVSWTLFSWPRIYVGPPSF